MVLQANMYLNGVDRESTGFAAKQGWWDRNQGHRDLHQLCSLARLVAEKRRKKLAGSLGVGRPRDALSRDSSNPQNHAHSCSCSFVARCVILPWETLLRERPLQRVHNIILVRASCCSSRMEEYRACDMW